MMTVDIDNHSTMIPGSDEHTDQRTITALTRMEDGWSVEVENHSGVRLTYWLADTGCIPHVGDRVTFYGGVLGQPLRGIAINDCRVYDSAAN